jgi:hypothetical protein
MVGRFSGGAPAAVARIGANAAGTSWADLAEALWIDERVTVMKVPLRGEAVRNKESGYTEVHMLGPTFLVLLWCLPC